MSIKKFRPCGDFRTSYSSDMSLFEKDPDSYQKLAEQTKQNKQKLHEKEETWLELELLREDLSRS